jgi:hypothetical protein
MQSETCEAASFPPGQGSIAVAATCDSSAAGKKPGDYRERLVANPMPPLSFGEQIPMKTFRHYEQFPAQLLT